MLKKEIATQAAPAALGPYSQGIQAGSFVFISGQLALVPETATLLDGSIGDQTRQIMKNIEAIIKEAGGSLDSLVKTTIFLTDLNDFQEVNQAYGAFFAATPPARATIQVAALPLGAQVEIEAVAIVG
jgi:2-iminobutanoate/2-iminopropanoate deaminase